MYKHTYKYIQIQELKIELIKLNAIIIKFRLAMNGLNFGEGRNLGLEGYFWLKETYGNKGFACCRYICVYLLGFSRQHQRNLRKRRGEEKRG